jgi:integrase/recombinase XerD
MKQARTITEKQLKAVMAYCSTRRPAARDSTIIATSFYAGLRAKEIAALKLTDVLIADNTVRNEFVLAAAQTEGEKIRRVFVSNKLKRELEAYLKYLKPSPRCGVLFQSQKDRAFSANTMCQLFLNIYKACGIDGASSHSGRRSLLTNLAARGVGVRALAEIAGHSSISMTQRYLDVNDEQMRAAVELA